MHNEPVSKNSEGVYRTERSQVPLSLLMGIVCLSQLFFTGTLLAQTTENREQRAPAVSRQVRYFPPPEKKGGWRSLLPKSGMPNKKQKHIIRKKCGIDWDELRNVWEFTRQAGGDSGFLVIRHGFIVGEWYQGCDRTTHWDIYSSAKAYTSTAYGVLMGDSKAGQLPPERQFNLETKVFTENFLPEALPLSDPRKAQIRLRHLLTMTAGFAEVRLPATAPLEWALGKTSGSPMTHLAADPGSEFFYSNATAAHLVLLFHRLAGRDLFPYLKQRVFDPIGMETVRWKTVGGHGHLGPYSKGYSGLVTTARDHARFCHLALHRGNWSGCQLVPQEYFDFAWQGTNANPQYGAMWWVDRLPDLVTWTRGARKNNGYVVPSRDLIFIRVGNATAQHFPENFEIDLAKKVINTIKD